MELERPVCQVMYESSTENPEYVEAEVIGEIPKWVNGSLLRLGPGKFEWGDFEYNHWFDGEGILHRFGISNGSVSFSSRFVHSMSYLEAQKRGVPAFTQFGTNAPPDPCKNIFARFFSYFIPPEITDNCNVNVVTYGKDIIASTEGPKMWAIDPETLETIKPVNVGKLLGENRSWTAHPHYDSDGNTYNVSTRFLESQMDFVKFSKDFDISSVPDKSMDIIASVKYDGKPGYFHSFAMTDNFIVLLENPVVFGQYWWLLVMKIMDWSYCDMLVWDQNRKTKVTVVDRVTGEVKKVHEFEPAFVFHHVNAYEENNEIVMDVCGYNNCDIMNVLYLHELRRGISRKLDKAGELRRYRIPLGDQSERSVPGEDCSEYEVLKEGFELPRINYNFNGKKYRYAYGLGPSEDLDTLTTLIKVDVVNQCSIEWSEEDCYPSEPVFISSPDAENEDDGVVLSSIMGVKGKKSFLIILDGKTFTEIARAVVPVELKPLVHGAFFEK